jgi:hypothetical protein
MTSGEMLLISCAIIGPLLYVISKRYGNLEDPLTLRFPYSLAFSLVIITIWFISGGVFTAKKLGSIYVDLADILDNGAMWNLSAAITLAAILTLYCATVFRNYMDRIDPGSLMHAEQEEFVRDFTNG